MEAQDQPANVMVVERLIVIDGPGGMTATLTPTAVIETAKRLMDAAEEAAAVGDR